MGRILFCCFDYCILLDGVFLFGFGDIRVCSLIGCNGWGWLGLLFLRIWCLFFWGLIVLGIRLVVVQWWLLDLFGVCACRLVIVGC